MLFGFKLLTPDLLLKQSTTSRFFSSSNYAMKFSSKSDFPSKSYCVFINSQLRFGVGVDFFSQNEIFSIPFQSQTITADEMFSNFHVNQTFSHLSVCPSVASNQLQRDSNPFPDVYKLHDLCFDN